MWQSECGFPLATFSLPVAQENVGESEQEALWAIPGVDPDRVQQNTEVFSGRLSVHLCEWEAELLYRKERQQTGRAFSLVWRHFFITGSLSWEKNTQLICSALFVLRPAVLAKFGVPLVIVVIMMDRSHFFWLHKQKTSWDFMSPDRPSRPQGTWAKTKHWYTFFSVLKKVLKAAVVNIFVLTKDHMTAFSS